MIIYYIIDFLVDRKFVIYKIFWILIQNNNYTFFENIIKLVYKIIIIFDLELIK